MSLIEKLKALPEDTRNTVCSELMSRLVGLKRSRQFERLKYTDVDYDSAVDFIEEKLNGNRANALVEKINVLPAANIKRTKKFI